MTIGENFKDIIKNESIDQEDFLVFIDDKFDEVVEEYSLSEVIDFVIYHGNSWKLKAIFSLYPSIFRDLNDLAEMVSRSERIDLIGVFNDVFWKRHLFSILSSCAKQQSTNFACEVIKQINLEESEDMTDIEFVNLNKIFYYACLRNELDNIKTLILAGANPGFSVDGVNALAVLKWNRFDAAYHYISKKFPNVKETGKQELLNDEISLIIEDYRKGCRIEDLSFYIAKFGGEILNKKNENGEDLFDLIISTGNLKFFLRMYSILNNKSEKVIKDLVGKAKKLGQIKIMNKLIEESIK